MRVIEAEIGEHGYGPREWEVVRRVIHTTADFDFAGANAVYFAEGAVDAGTGALRSGRAVVTDVSAVYGGMNKRNPGRFGNEVVCRISDPRVAEYATEHGLTRAEASMRMSASQVDGGVVAVGNAPTALLEVMRMHKEGLARPALVVGLPVGFISAAESKAELASSGMTCITNSGRKGGSAVAAAVINALYKMI